MPDATQKRDAGAIPRVLGRICTDRENEWVCDMVTAHKFNEKITKELLAETRSPHQGEKDIEHSKAVKTNLFGAPATTSLKKEAMGYLQPRGRSGNHPNGYQNNQRGRENLPSPNRFHRSYNPNANYMQEQMLTTCKKKAAISKKMKIPSLPRTITIQWHMTNSCHQAAERKSQRKSSMLWRFRNF